MRVEVTVEFTSLGASSRPEDVPTAGIVCRLEGNTAFGIPAGAEKWYDLRVGSDGRYAIYRHVGDTAVLLGSSFTQGLPPIAVNGPMTIVAVCRGEFPTLLSLTVNEREAIRVLDRPPSILGTGHAAIIVGAGSSPGTSVLFRNLRVARLR